MHPRNAAALVIITGLCLALQPGALQAQDTAKQPDQSAASTGLRYATVSSLALRAPKEDKVVWSGVVSFDQAGTGSAQILYPAPGALGLLAAVLTHAAIVDSAKRSQKSQMQLDADKILVPFEPVLSKHSQRELLADAIKLTRFGGSKQVLETDSPNNAQWLVESTPTFWMTQDQSALILENLISISDGTNTAPAYQSVIRAVSPRVAHKDIIAHWSAESGKRLKDETAALVAHSIDVALSDLQKLHVATPTQKTFRYAEGSIERMERASFFTQTCERVVVKTLRGGLLSFPVSADTQRSEVGICPEEKKPS
jgi:hypothetical protein